MLYLYFNQKMSWALENVSKRAATIYNKIGKFKDTLAWIPSKHKLLGKFLTMLLAYFIFTIK